jgi:hypothetical protein
MWPTIAVAAVVVVALIALQMARPGMKRRAAVRKAVEEAQRAADANANDAGAQVRLARVYLELAEEPQKALDLLSRVVAADASHWTGDGPPTRFLLAHAHVMTGDLARGIETYQSFIAGIDTIETGGDKERKFLLHTHKVDAEQRIRLLKKGDTHVHQPERWGDAE